MEFTQVNWISNKIENMKQLFTLSLLVFFTAQMNAQVTLIDGSGAIVNNEVVVYLGPVDPSVIDSVSVFEVDIEVHVAGEDKTLNVRRYELNVQMGTENYFCWGVCYNARYAGVSPVWESLPQHAVTVLADSSASNFHAYHKPRNIVGVNVYRYVWFDVNNPTDSVWCDIEFRSGIVGINEETEVVRSMQVFPNPSLGSDVAFKIELNGSVTNTSLVIYNMVGERLKTIRINGAQGRYVLPTTDLSSGIYFATLERNGTSLRSQRFVVTH